MTDAALVRLSGLSKVYKLERQSLFGAAAQLTAVNDVSLEIRQGTTFAIVGESGCGKSTLGKLLLRLEAPSAGKIEIDGIDLASTTQEQDVRLRSHVQVVMQDPYAAMNPRQRIASYVTEPARVGQRMGAAAAAEKARSLVSRVGLAPSSARLYPHEFSGGQRQRLAIARALSVEPRLIVLDEPVSALDVSVRAQILNLLRDLQDDFGLTYLFISHDLAIVEFMADDVGVMYLGELVETGPRQAIFGNPRHPYTRALLGIARANESGARSLGAGIGGTIPSPLDIPSGCPFRTRCPSAVAQCAAVKPVLEVIENQHAVACHRHREFPPLTDIPN